MAFPTSARVLQNEKYRPMRAALSLYLRRRLVQAHLPMTAGGEPRGTDVVYCEKVRIGCIESRPDSDQDGCRTRLRIA